MRQGEIVIQVKVKGLIAVHIKSPHILRKRQVHEKISETVKRQSIANKYEIGSFIPAFWKHLRRFLFLSCYQRFKRNIPTLVGVRENWYSQSAVGHRNWCSPSSIPPKKSFLRSIQQYPSKLKIAIPLNSAISFLGINPTEIFACVHKEICITMS